MKASLIVLGLIGTALVIDVNGQNPARPSNAETFDLSRTVDQFYLAWRCSQVGISDREALVLMFRKSDGSYMAAYQSRERPRLAASQQVPHGQAHCRSE